LVCSPSPYPLFVDLISFRTAPPRAFPLFFCPLACLFPAFFVDWFFFPDPFWTPLPTPSPIETLFVSSARRRAFVVCRITLLGEARPLEQLAVRSFRPMTGLFLPPAQWPFCLNPSLLPQVFLAPTAHPLVFLIFLSRNSVVKDPARFPLNPMLCLSLVVPTTFSVSLPRAPF